MKLLVVLSVLALAFTLAAGAPSRTRRSFADCQEESGGDCEKEKWLGDGHCGKSCNYEACDWDGGDCANPESTGDDNASGVSEDSQDSDGESESGAVSTGDESGESSASGDGETEEYDWEECQDASDGDCARESWIGDGHCGKSCNYAECGWDGGDCANPESTGDDNASGASEDSDGESESGAVSTGDESGDESDGGSTYDWDECVAASGGKCQKERWLGDGHCGKSCNFPECANDGGDCE